MRRFVNIFANDEDIRFLKNLDTPVKDSDEISIVPAIAGGARSDDARRRGHRRYARQIALPEIGPEGQARICAARVAVVGADLAAETAALYLRAAGVGTVRSSRCTALAERGRRG